MLVQASTSCQQRRGDFHSALASTHSKSQCRERPEAFPTADRRSDSPGRVSRQRCANPSDVPGCVTVPPLAELNSVHVCNPAVPTGRTVKAWQNGSMRHAALQTVALAAGKGLGARRMLVVLGPFAGARSSASAGADVHVARSKPAWPQWQRWRRVEQAMEANCSQRALQPLRTAWPSGSHAAV